MDNTTRTATVSVHNPLRVTGLGRRGGTGGWRSPNLTGLLIGVATLPISCSVTVLFLAPSGLGCTATTTQTDEMAYLLTAAEKFLAFAA